MKHMTASEMLEELKAAGNPEPDYSRGLTAKEWGRVWGVTATHASRLLSKGAEEGLYVTGKDWRRMGNGTRLAVVYKHKSEPTPVPEDKE